MWSLNTWWQALRTELSDNIWDKMCSKNSDQIQVIFSPSLWLQCALLCFTGSLELACNWTTPQVIRLAKSKLNFIFREFVWQTLNHHDSSTVRAFDLIPKLKLGLSIRYHLVHNIPCDSHRHFLQIETINSSMQNHSHPRSNAINHKFMKWIGLLFCLQTSYHIKMPIKEYMWGQHFKTTCEI